MTLTFRGRGSFFGGPSDPTDSGRTALGLTTAVPGVALRPGADYMSGKPYLGGYWLITAPNGKRALLRQTDIGPNQSTGRRVDVTYSALSRLGYSQNNFPTDGNFKATYLGKDLSRARQRVQHAYGGGPSPSSPSQGGSHTTTTVSPPQLDTSPAEGITGLLAGLQAQSRPVVQTAGVQSPAFSAERYLNMPASPQSAGVQVPQKSNLADLLGNLPQGPQNVPGSVETTTKTVKPAGAITKPGSAPNQLASFIERANNLDAQHLPYLWGGGHGGKVTNTKKTQPLDCSGAVSAVLGIDPRVSGQFESFGSPGRSPSGKGITIYANEKHVLMEINGHFFGTSASNPGGGAGWIPRSALPAGYLKNFTARHLSRFG